LLKEKNYCAYYTKKFKKRKLKSKKIEEKIGATRSMKLLLKNTIS